MKKSGWVILALALVLTLNFAAEAAEPSYLIGPGDLIEISVWKDEALSRQLTVPPDGVISFPLIGDLDVTQMTVSSLREAITKRLSAYVPDATVTVMILKMDSLKAFVIGKVNRPGEFPITLETSVMQILSMAGGLNPYASESKIHVLRRKSKETVKIPFDYKEVLKGENLGQNIVLERGDVVVVP